MLPLFLLGLACPSGAAVCFFAWLLFALAEWFGCGGWVWGKGLLRAAGCDVAQMEFCLCLPWLALRFFSLLFSSKPTPRGRAVHSRCLCCLLLLLCELNVDIFCDWLVSIVICQDSLLPNDSM